MEKPKDSKPAPAKPKREAATNITISGGKVLLTPTQLRAMQATKEIAAVVSAIGTGADVGTAADQVVKGIRTIIESGDVQPKD